MGPGFSNREANVNPTVVDQGQAVATATADDVAHAAHEVYESPLRAWTYRTSGKYGVALIVMARQQRRLR